MQLISLAERARLIIINYIINQLEPSQTTVVTWYCEVRFEVALPSIVSEPLGSIITANEPAADMMC
jgi:hypothetical protein